MEPVPETMMRSACDRPAKQPHTLMENTRTMIYHRLGVHALVALALLAGVFFLRQDLQGKTSLPPVSPTEDTEAPIETAAEVAAEASVAPTPAVLPDSAIENALRNPKAVKPLPVAYIDTETLWLARVIYSESKRIEEQELVAWVVRNRVETAYRGKRTYEDVALDPYQFSAFNPNSRKHRYYSNLDADSQARGWQKTIAIAYYVRHAREEHRPFPIKTRHFYSEQALPEDVDHPKWTIGLEPVVPRRPLQLDAQRFRFYSGVV